MLTQGRRHPNIHHMTAVISGTSTEMDKGNVGLVVALYAAVEGKGAPASEEDECEGKDRVKRIETVLESRAVWSLQCGSWVLYR